MIQLPIPVFWLLCALALWGVISSLLRFLRRSRPQDDSPHTIYPSHLPPFSDVHPPEPPRGYQWKLVASDSKKSAPD